MKLVLDFGYRLIFKKMLRDLAEIKSTQRMVLTQMASNQADLDADIVTVLGTFTDLNNKLTESIAAQAAAFKLLNDKIAAGATPADLQPEVDNLTALNTAMQASVAAIQAAIVVAQAQGK